MMSFLSLPLSLSSVRVIRLTLEVILSFSIVEGDLAKKGTFLPSSPLASFMLWVWAAKALVIILRSRSCLCVCFYSPRGTGDELITPRTRRSRRLAKGTSCGCIVRRGLGWQWVVGRWWTRCRRRGLQWGGGAFVLQRGWGRRRIEVLEKTWC